MKWSLLIAKISGIKIYLHWTFSILLIWVVFLQEQQGAGWNDTLISLAFVITIFACVLLHELGHALTAKRYNITTKDIILLPIGGLARLEKIPEKPSQEFWVAIAGPAVNLLIALILFGLVYAINPGSFESQLSNYEKVTLDNFLISLLLVNIFIAIFNLIPAFPMDGGRVFRALLSMQIGRLKATQVAASLGQMLAIVFALAGLFFNPFLVLIAIFVYLGAQYELEQVKYKSALSDYKVSDITMHHFTKLSVHDSLSEAVKQLLDGQEKEFIVTDNDSTSGILTRDIIIKSLSQNKLSTPLGEVMKRDIQPLSPDDTLSSVLEKMQKDKLSVYPVEDDGKLVGMIDQENILEFIMIQNVLDGKSRFAVT